MDEEMKQLIGGILEVQKDLSRQCYEAKTESAALQALCSILCVHIAEMDDEPRTKLDEILRGFQGAGGAVAQQAGSVHSTLTIENICAMAEALMPPD